MLKNPGGISEQIPEGIPEENPEKIFVGAIREILELTSAKSLEGTSGGISEEIPVESADFLPEKHHSGGRALFRTMQPTNFLTLFLIERTLLFVSLAAPGSGLSAALFR